MTPENAEDVSYGYVPGSTGTAGPVVTPWTARRSPDSDEARRAALTVLDPILSKFRPKAQKRAPARSASIRTARAKFFQE